MKEKVESLWIWVLALLGLLLAEGLLLWWLMPSNRVAQDTAAPPQAKSLTPDEIARVVHLLKENKSWAGFMLQFEAIHPGLMATIALRHPDLSPTDVRILALSRLGLSADEFGELLNISTESAKKARYRTRKRLGIPADQSLMQYMLQG